MSRLIVRHGVFGRGPFRGGLGEDPAPAPAVVPPAVDSTILQAVSDRTSAILKKIEDQEQYRKWTLIIGGASAVFAAVKLGIITFGAIKLKSRSGS